jgi:DNA-binding MarR family transcriptional regulator
MPNRANIAELVDRLGRIAHSLQFSCGLNPAQWEALRFLARANRYSSTPSALAEYLGTTKGTVSQTLIALEAKGFIRRKRCLDDRRSVKLSLTASGRDMLEKDPIRMLDAVGDNMSAAERRALTDGMCRLIDSLNRAQGSPAFGVCSHCSYHSAAGGRAGDGAPCYCGYTNEPLSEEETRKICVNFAAAP